MGEFWLTTLSAIRRRDPDWQAIAAYEAPVRRFLSRRFGGLPEAERDDLVQEILIAMHERIVSRYDAEAGPFRAYLRTAIHNKVRDLLRRRRGTGGVDEDVHVALPSEAEADTLDLEARVVRAVQRVHDRHVRGPEQDLPLIYVLSGALVDQLSNAEIARREGLSVDQVKRKLQKARGEILTGVFLDMLPTEDQAADAERCAELARGCLRAPRKETRLLEGQAHAELVASFTRIVRDSGRVLTGEGSADALDLLRGIQAIFSE